MWNFIFSACLVFITSLHIFCWVNQSMLFRQKIEYIWLYFQILRFKKRKIGACFRTCRRCRPLSSVRTARGLFSLVPCTPHHTGSETGEKRRSLSEMPQFSVDQVLSYLLKRNYNFLLNYVPYLIPWFFGLKT